MSNVVEELKKDGAVELLQTEQTAIAKVNKPETFRTKAISIALDCLSDMVGEERAKEAAGRVATALAVSESTASDPKAFHNCTQKSIGAVVAIAALTGIYPSTGATALAYAIPRSPRKGEPPQLTYMLSHRGINALANRAGSHMVAIPISYTDKIKTTDTGDVTVESMDLDNPPTKEDELRGVIVQVKRIDSGMLICSGWVPKKLILERREGSDGYRYAEKPGNEWAKSNNPWHKWFVPMAMKTAMHYAIARGWCVIDDTEAQRALDADVESDIIDGEVIRSTQGRLVRNELPTEQGA